MAGIGLRRTTSGLLIPIKLSDIKKRASIMITRNLALLSLLVLLGGCGGAGPEQTGGSVQRIPAVPTAGKW